MTPRGIRNNNPLNLRLSKSPWVGKIAPSHDPDFEQFGDAEDGIRAGAKNMLTHFKRGENTVAKQIARHAPPNENNTARYTEYVAGALGVRSDAVIDLLRLDVLTPMVTAIIQYENGSCPYSSEIIQKACRRALGQKQKGEV